MKTIAVLALFVGFTAADTRTSELATTPSATAGSDSHSVITEYRLPPNKLEKAKSLYRTHVAMFVVSTIYGLAVIHGLTPDSRKRLRISEARRKGAVLSKPNPAFVFFFAIIHRFTRVLDLRPSIDLGIKVKQSATSSSTAKGV